MTDLFKAPITPVAGDEIKSYRELLVGEGKKFRDEEALAKGKYEADLYVKTLEEKADDLQRELKTRMSLEEFMTKNFDRTSESNRNSNQGSDENHDGDSNKNIAVNKTVDETQITDMVQKAIVREQARQAQSSNAELVRQELIKVWGSNYTSKLQERANELGVGADFLNDLATKSPKAFMSVVGLAGGTNRNAPNATLPPSNRVNASVQLLGSEGSNSGVRDKKYYDKMRTEDYKRYTSAETTVQRHKDAIAMGEAFFKD